MVISGVTGSGPPDGGVPGGAGVPTVTSEVGAVGTGVSDP